MAPTLRALLAGPAGHLRGDGGPSVAVLGLFARRNVIAQKKFLRCGRCRCVRYGAYLKCGELDVFDVGPWRTLEV